MPLAASNSGLNHAGFLVYKKPVAAGSGLVWLLEYAVGMLAFSLSGLPCLICWLAFHPLVYGHNDAC